MFIEQVAGPCRRRRGGCAGTGFWKPFYRAFICVSCLALDQRDVSRGDNPPGDGGVGTLFRQAED